jgi:hypothetical protein
MACGSLSLLWLAQIIFAFQIAYGNRHTQAGALNPANEVTLYKFSPPESQTIQQGSRCKFKSEYSPSTSTIKRAIIESNFSKDSHVKGVTVFRGSRRLFRPKLVLHSRLFTIWTYIGTTRFFTQAHWSQTSYFYGSSKFQLPIRLANRLARIDAKR